MPDTSKISTGSEDVGQLKQAALDHLWMPFTQHSTTEEQGGPMIIVEGEGVRVKDSEGKSYIDGIGGLFLINVGHGRQEIIDAVARQLGDIHYASTFNFASVPTIKLAERLAGLAPGNLEKVFFTSGGSEAVETALKMARQYHVNNDDSRRTKFMARRGSYHGVSLGALSVNSSAFVRRNIWENLVAPFVVFVGPTPEDLEEAIMFEGPETVAGFITEPVSVPSGVHPPADDYWPRLREICDKHGVLLIADEVITGFGRTGKLFAMEHWGVTPDLMTFAKGVTSGYQPVGGVLASDSVAEAFVGGADKTFTHGFTYSGHPAGAAAAMANLDILERENLVENAADVGGYLLDQLGSLKEHSIVGDVRGLGLLLAIEMVKDKATSEPLEYGSPILKVLNEKMVELGLLTRAEPFVYLSPPLTLTRSEADEIVGILDAAIAEAEKVAG